MCGIFAYIGHKNASEAVIKGLKRLDYRGYDSWGIAVQADNQIKSIKRVGKISEIKELKFMPKATIGIGHTRWATHGSITKTNAHPHFSTDKTFVLAQNGIVENYLILKKRLRKKGFKFISQTDTEVIVRLIEDNLNKTKNLRKAVTMAFQSLEGRNTIILLAKNGDIIAARNGSPLVIGFSKSTAEIFFSSDTLSFAPYAKEMIVVENGQLAEFSSKKIHLYDVKTNKKINYKLEKVDLQGDRVDKEGFDYFMIKEIHDSDYVIRQVLNQNKNDYLKFAKAIKSANNIYVIGSGSTGVAAAQISFYLRSLAGISSTSIVGAEGQSYYNLFKKNDLLIAPSQSGETADVLEVLEYAKKKKLKIASYVNMSGSMITRMSDFKFMAQAGPEICVMSTKVFVSQISWGYLISKTVAGQFNDGVNQLQNTAKAISLYLKNKKNHTAIKHLAKKLIKKNHIFLLGKSQNLQIVIEGMIKIIEGTYLHAHAIAAGDLKHYAITIMEKGVPVIVVSSNDQAKKDVINATNVVKARQATVIGIAPEIHDNFDFYLKVKDLGETSAILNIILLQLLAYYMTVELGHNVDKPRNIAKSVTVK